MAKDDLAFKPAWELRDLIASRKVSPVELTEMYLRRIEALNPKLNAYLTVTADEALASAKKAEQAVMRGQRLGPLHGVPISIKDLEMTRGTRTTFGSLIYKDFVPEIDSVVVERVRKSGAIILGKTNTPEFGLSATTENRVADPCRNPWDPQRTPGGSSGGAGAALIAGLCAIATGSDGGGSIRIPCSFTGTYGIKPTQGRVPRYGGVGKTAPNQTSQSGPMSRTVKDSAILLQVLSGHDPRDPISLQQRPPNFLAALDKGVRGLRIAWSGNLGYAAVEPEVMEATSKAARVFEELGATVEEPNLALSEPYPPFFDLFSTNTYAAYGHLYEEQRDKLADYSVTFMEHGKKVTGAQYARVIRYIDGLKLQMDTFMKRYDLLLTPSMAVVAFPIGRRPTKIAGRDSDPWWGFMPFTFPFNMTGQPAASIPCGFSKEGLPMGLHIIGRRGDEATVLRASAAFEQARPWHSRRPPVS